MIAEKPVVVGVDGSTAALDAVRWGAAVAADLGAPLVLGTAVSASAFGDNPVTPDDDVRRILDVAEQAARDSVDDRRSNGTNIRITTETHHGTPAGVLVERSASASLIVVGTRGLGEFTGGLSASVSTAVATHAECAVAVVPSTTRAPGPIVVGVDGTENSVAALTFAFRMASSRQVELVAVHAWSDVDIPGERHDRWTHTSAGEEAALSETLAGWSQDYPDVTVRRIVVRDRPVRELVARSADASLVVVGRRGRGGFTSLLLGSTSRAVLHSVDVPVVVVPTVH
ncbi:MAG: universal stress protein [Rhodococcus sp. (in: high G+C Gram-positive bacteria)]